jgi:hypothetical protein
MGRDRRCLAADADLATVDAASELALQRLLVEEQSRSPHLGARAGSTDAATAADGVTAGAALHGSSSGFVVISLLVAARSELPMPEDLHSVGATREALLDLAGALRARDDVVASADFAAPVSADEAEHSRMSARDQLYLHYPSLVPL